MKAREQKSSALKGKALHFRNKKNLIVNSTIGVVALLLFAFFIMKGFGYIKNLIVPEMKNPDSLDPSITEVELPPYTTPDDLTQLTSGTIIYSGAINTLAKINLPQFGSVADIPDEYLVSFGLWQAILSEKYAESLNYPNEQSVKIPASVVLEAAKEYFDFDRELKLADNSLLGTFSYNAVSSSFTSPITGIESTYLPRVKSVVSVDNVITIKLEFVSSDEQWAYDEYGGSGSSDSGGSGQPQAKRAVELKVTPIANQGYKILSMTDDVM